MKQEDIEKVEKVEQAIDGFNVGYAYLYPNDDSARQEYVFDMTPENIANFLGSHQFDAEKIVLTDMLDRLILDTTGGFINNCPNQELCKKYNNFTCAHSDRRERSYRVSNGNKRTVRTIHIYGRTGSDGSRDKDVIELRHFMEGCNGKSTIEFERVLPISRYWRNQSKGNIN